MKSTPVYMSTHWLQPVPDSQCQGHRDLNTNIFVKTLTLLYHPGIPRSGPTALPSSHSNILPKYTLV